MRVKWAGLYFFFVGLVIFPSCPCLGQSAKQAVRALQRVQAKVEVGPLYQDYSLALGDAKFEVNLFLKSPQAKSRTELGMAIGSAMRHYENAKETWDIKVNTGYDYITIDLQNKLSNSLFKDYPEIVCGYDFQVDKAVLIIWREASKELEKAVSLLK